MKPEALTPDTLKPEALTPEAPTPDALAPDALSAAARLRLGGTACLSAGDRLRSRRTRWCAGRPEPRWWQATSAPCCGISAMTERTPSASRMASGSLVPKAASVRTSPRVARAAARDSAFPASVPRSRPHRLRARTCSRSPARRLRRSPRRQRSARRRRSSCRWSGNPVRVPRGPCSHPGRPVTVSCGTQIEKSWSYHTSELAGCGAAVPPLTLASSSSIRAWRALRLTPTRSGSRVCSRSGGAVAARGCLR